MNIELSQREVNTILNALYQEHNRVAKSRAKSWRPSTKALAMADIDRIMKRITEAEINVD